MMSAPESSAIKSAPYFLSTLSSTAVPEHEDATFSCRVAGNPRPEIIWYKMGQEISEEKEICSFEKLEDNVVHILHLFRCTKEQAGVYQAVARNCFGSAKSSAFLRVISAGESEGNQTFHSSPKDAIDICRTNGITLGQQENSSETIESKAIENSHIVHKCLLSSGSLEPPRPEPIALSSDQRGPMSFQATECECCPSVKNQHKNSHGLEAGTEVRDTSHQGEEKDSLWSSSIKESNPFNYDSIDAYRDPCEGKADEFRSSSIDSKPAAQFTGHTDSCSCNTACQTTEYAKTHEECSLSKLPKKQTLSENPAEAPLENQTCCLEGSSENVHGNFDLWLAGNLITAADESFDDDHQECWDSSSVVVDDTYQSWEDKLKFLLESDDEGDSLIPGSDCDGCAYFLSEMPCLFQVSDNTMPMDATIGLCGHQSKSKGVAVRSDLTVFNPSTSPEGMTLTVGQEQSEFPATKNTENYNLTSISMAIESDYPRSEEESRSNGASAVGVPGNLHGTEHRISDMKSSSYSLGGSAQMTSKLTVDQDSLRKTPQKLTKMRNQATEGRSKVKIAGRTKPSKDSLNQLQPKVTHTSEIHPAQVERNYLNLDTLLHRKETSVSTHGMQDSRNASNQIGLFQGEEISAKSGVGKGKRISSSTEGSQIPNDITPMHEADIRNTAPTHNDLKLFIAEPLPDERCDLPSPTYCVPVPAEKTASENIHAKNGLQKDNAMLEKSNGLCVPNGTCKSGEWKVCWDQKLDLTTLNNVANHDVAPETHWSPNSTSVPDMQIEREKACGEKPNEVNEVKTACDTPCVEYVHRGALESAKPNVRDADLSLVHEQLQKLLYEDEDWGYGDFICASGEVKSLAAGTDSAKEAEGLSITGDISARKHVPENLTEDNQLVTELAKEMKGHTDYCNLLKTSEASAGSHSLTLPVNIDATCACSACGRTIEQPSVHPVRSNLPKEIFGPSISAQTPPFQDEEMRTDHSSHPFAGTTPLTFTNAPCWSLGLAQDILSDFPANGLGPSSHMEQDVHCTDGPIAKQAHTMGTEEPHVTLCHSKRKKSSNFAEVSLRKDSPSNFSDKGADQFAGEEHFSVTVADKGSAEKFQEEGTESDRKAENECNCGAFHVLKGKNGKDVQDAAQNYSNHMIQEHHSDLGTESKAIMQSLEETSQNEKRMGKPKEDPVFTASYKVRFYTEVLLEINHNNEGSMSQGNSDFGINARPSASQSKHVLEMPLTDPQLKIPGKDADTEGCSCPSAKELELDSACSVSEPLGLLALNTNQLPSMIRNNYNTGQGNQNAVGQAACCQDGNQIENGCRVCQYSNINVLESVDLSLETFERNSMQAGIPKDKNTMTSAIWQDQDRRVKDESAVQIAQHGTQRETDFDSVIEEAEVEPYMRAVFDSEQALSWHGDICLQHSEYQKVETESQSQISSPEKDDTDCDLETAEAEPYMRMLINSEQIPSWHAITDCMLLSTAPFGEQAGASVVGCVVSSRGHDQDRTFTDSERQSLNSLAGTTVTLNGASLCASESGLHSQEQLPQFKAQLGALGTTGEEPCGLKKGKSQQQEVLKVCKPPLPHNGSEDVKRKQDAIKKKAPKVQIKKPRLEAKENLCSSVSCTEKISKAEPGTTHKEEKREQQKLLHKKESKAPKLLKQIQAEPFPDFSGNIKLCCQFEEIHEDSTITWTKDSKLLARIHRSAGEDFPVSLAIVQAGKKDQGLYQCCLKNVFGRTTAEFNLTSEVLEHLSNFQDVEGFEEIEFLQLMFREDFICDSYLSKSLRGRITTEELHFGEGVHRKAFRSKVMQGLVPIFGPGHPCVLKVHNAIAYGTKNKDELVKKNYKLALEECYVQNTAREYAKMYAAETNLLEGFGEVPEIIPIFLIHRPKNNIPYATVEEELIGEFVKYSVKDGKEINFMRRDSEAGQKCCTFQHWVYEKTGGSLLVTDMQGVGMKLTDIGIATAAKGYKGFKGNCSISFIDQFKALHQCNKYCEMLGLKSLQTNSQKLRRSSAARIKVPPSSSLIKRTVISAPEAKKT